MMEKLPRGPSRRTAGLNPAAQGSAISDNLRRGLSQRAAGFNPAVKGSAISQKLRRGPSERQGTTLVEILLMTTLLSILLGFSITLLAKSIRIAGESQQLQDRHLRIYRLAETFREDFRLADSWEIVSPEELRFNLSGRTIEYLAAEDEVRRQERGVDELDDTFRLTRSVVRFESDSSGPLALLIDTEVGHATSAQPDERPVATGQLRIEGWKSP